MEDRINDFEQLFRGFGGAGIGVLEIETPAVGLEEVMAEYENAWFENVHTCR